MEMQQQEKMIGEIKDEFAYVRNILGGISLSEQVLEAIKKVPRHKFVPTEMQRYAYDNSPASIGYGQTISQPFIVALMTEMLCPNKDDKVLEVGAGSGYQAAVLSLLVKHVYSMEIIHELGDLARDRLDKLGYSNTTVGIGDGYFGWPEHAPFDKIIVTAAVTHIPQPLIDQLTPGGRMVLPVGQPYMNQSLILLEKDARGQVATSNVLGVIFVPLTGKHEINQTLGADL